MKIIFVVIALSVIIGAYVFLIQESSNTVIEEEKNAKNNENKLITIEYSKSKTTTKKKVSLPNLQKQTKNPLKKDYSKELTPEQERMKSQYEAHEIMRKENNRAWRREQLFYKMQAERQNKIKKNTDKEN